MHSATRPCGLVAMESPPESAPISTEDQNEIMQQLWRIYNDMILPLEKKSHYDHFCAPPITAEEFVAKPQVLLVGQYSTGKTSMVKWLAGPSKYFDIRPAPSTDKFMAVVHGNEEKDIQGDAAICLPQLPYRGLACFGENFLKSFQAVVMPADILKHVTFIDTPGVLSGAKHRLGRKYNFATVTAWMAERADLILLTFDSNKLDISDEFEEIIEVLKPFSNKVRCVLNKADQLDRSNLVRVYGALLWSIGKVLRTPEMAKVFVSSFWNEEYRYADHKDLFNEDKEAIVKELHSLPGASLLRKINTLVVRARRVRAHLCVVGHVRSQLPWLPRAIASEQWMRRWLDANLPRLFDEVQRIRGISAGDMPDIKDFCARLKSFEVLTRLPTWEARDVARLNRVMEVEVPTLIGKAGGVGTPVLNINPESANSASSDWGWPCKRRRLQY